ncbi:MerR family transcriptional regulator [Streptomyces filamentosus]|uniref:MerR family transcriptional regulator n=1 Tax=Streptomyces filamentosus TaxID=67294 RepID=UPI0036EEEBDF
MRSEVSDAAYLRPADLAREHGISPQAVRTYERDGLLPAAARTEGGHRRYTGRHAAALRAYRALVAAYGHTGGAEVMRAVVAGRVDEALAAVDRGHAELLRDRGALDAVEEVLERVRKKGPRSGRDGGDVREGGGGRGGRGDWTGGDGRDGWSGRGSGGDARVFSVGEVARRIGVSAATLRAWEEAGVLVPGRRGGTGHRAYGSDDVRDAELAHFLRRGRYSLELVATVLRQLREAGGAPALAAAHADWRRRVTARGLAMLTASARLSEYLTEVPPMDPPEEAPTEGHTTESA